MRARYPNLRVFLEKSGKTQSEFASELGIAQSSVSLMVNGKRVPGLSLALRIAEVASVPVESLVSAAEEAVAS